MRPVVDELREQLARDREVVIGADHLFLAALRVRLRLEDGDRRQQADADPCLVLVDGAIRQCLGFALDLEVLARPHDAPVALDHLLHEVGELRLVLKERRLRRLLGHPDDEIGKIPAEVAEQRLDDGEVQLRLVLRPELLEARIGVEAVVQEVDGGERAGPERLEQVKVRAPVVRDERARAGERARIRRDAVGAGQLAGERGVEARLCLQDGRLLPCRLEALRRDAGVVLERDGDRLLERHLLDLVVARDRRRDAERVALRQAAAPGRHEAGPAPGGTADVGGPFAGTRDRRGERRHEQASEKAARHCECR